MGKRSIKEFMHCLVTRLSHFSRVPMLYYRDNCEAWNCGIR